MRTRTRNSTAITTSAAKTYETSWNVSSGNYMNSRGSWIWGGHTLPLGNTEVIVDELPGFERYGNCSHTVVMHSIPSHPVDDYVRLREYNPSVIPGYWYEARYRAEPSALFNRAWSYAAVRNYTPVTTDLFSEWQSMSGEAVRSMSPSFNDGNSFVNFVLELKDLKRIPDVWRKWKHLKKLPSLKGKTANKASEAYLSYMFGIAPLISDVSSLLESLIKFRKKLRKLIELQGKPITRHYRAGVPYKKFNSGSWLVTEGGIVMNSSTIVYPNSGGQPVYAYAVKGINSWVETPVYCASMRFTYKLPDMSQIDNQLKAFADTLGVRPNPAIIWNATRLSFLVDWVVGVGDWLDSLSMDNLKLPVVIEDFCHSVKFSIQTEIETHDYGRVDLCYTKKLTSYTRIREVPWLGHHNVRSGSLNLRKASLGAALLTVNWKPSWSRKAGRWIRK